MSRRNSGILLHITSLPSPYGIGDLGPSAYRFAGFLSDAGQKYWQILPITQTSSSYDHSPYLCSSAFAGNTNLISPELLVSGGFLDKDDPGDIPGFPQDFVDFRQVIPYKERLFSGAYERFLVIQKERDTYESFCRENDWWLDDYALFRSLHRFYGEVSWNRWPDLLKLRRKESLDEMNGRLCHETGKEKFLQYIFSKQWDALRRYCTERGIRIIGDLPLYVNYDSADVWTHPELFQLDDRFLPTGIAGVPPDYFSKTGQLWKNPLYRWQEHERTGFSWWMNRFRQNFSLFDLLRIDHFRGLVAYWEVPAGAVDATCGRWVSAPTDSFFRALTEAFPKIPVIAEDLGVITPDVHAVMKKFCLPGMRVLQFAFTDETPDNPHAPHNLSQELVLYTGTHDNPTVREWLVVQATPEDKHRLYQYLGKDPGPDELPEVFIRMAMMSVAGTVIIPLQDVLGLGAGSRMNIPGTDDGNWRWRVQENLMTEKVAGHLRDMTRVYGRA
ncbi:4-alpha-glucanotransferase [uncultured Methanoregula sp.]|uniref:4-alpha-glucanotransferase n=1 Tax=uncultured Methanoregula sp. TaxID=1005933 RepID=UPI002AAC1B46|nr:4-alpha-glucanotransferase [uncultured Methanoregula sp.]